MTLSHIGSGFTFFAVSFYRLLSIFSHIVCIVENEREETEGLGLIGGLA